MNNKRYFSQYESPNIVIVPTMSCNPPSPKKRKLSNNILVPIVNNEVNEKLTSAEEKKLEDSNVSKMVDKKECSSKSPTQKSSWATNYLQSIGRDKISSIWKRRIPRKSASQTCVGSIEPPKNISVPTMSSTIASAVAKTDIEKNCQLIIKKDMVADLNIKDSNNKIKYVTQTKNLNVKDKSKKNKQLNTELEKVALLKNPTEFKNNKTLNILSAENKNISNEPNKFKIDKIKKNYSHEKPFNICTSGGHSLRMKSREVINKTSQKDNSKRPSDHPTVRHRPKSENKVEKSNIKSVVIKEVQNNRNCNIKTKQTKSDNVKRLKSSSGEEKYKSSKYSMDKITGGSKKNIEVTKKYDKVRDSNKADVSRKTQNNTERKLKTIHDNTTTSRKMEPKEKISNNKFDSKASKKTNKSPKKRKTSKTKSYRKIKLVINLICNTKANPVQNNESLNNVNTKESKTCTVSNVDLDFLNDFDIDEIVDSLDTCEKHASENVLPTRKLNVEKIDKNSMIPNVQSAYIENNDAIDLIKTLKGEEDDDLMRISTENAKELWFRNVNNILKWDNNMISTDTSSVLIKAEEKEQLEILQSVSTNASRNLLIDKDLDIEKSCNAKETEKGGEIYQSTMISNENSKFDSFQLPIEDIRVRTAENLLKQLDDSKNIKTKEQNNIDPFISTVDSCSVFSKVNSDSCEELKLDNNIKKNINQKESIHRNSINTEKFIDNSLDQRNERVSNNDKNENKCLCDHKDQNIAHIDNMNGIEDKMTSSYLCSSNILSIDINRKCHESTIENMQNEEIPHELHLKNSEVPTNPYRKLVSEQQEDKTFYSNEKCNKTAKNVEISDNEINIVDNNTINQKLISQHNANVKNSRDQNNTAIISNVVSEETEVTDRKVQDDNPKTNHEEDNAQKDLKENKQSDLQNNNIETVEYPAKLSVSDTNLRGFNTKGSLETIRKLEERLYNCTGSKYSVSSFIHNGRYSKIFTCKHPNGKHYALKMITANIKYNLGKEKKDMLHSLISDIPKDNLFIVNLAKAFNIGEKWCYLMDYYPKNLQQILEEAGKPFSIDHIQDFARQLVMAVMVLKNKKMVHFDIKPQHVLINSSNNMLKLCGFDNLSYINKKKILPNVGTVNYRAPEVILGYESNFEIDVWSTGLVLYEMAANKKLFPGVFNNDILYKQICTLGCIPNDMLQKSRFSGLHFVGSNFKRRSGFKGQTVDIVSNFFKNNILCDSIYEAYYENWGRHRSVSEQNCDIGKIGLFIKLLQKMLTMHPDSRLPIEFVYANPFIYDAYSYQEW